MKKAIIGVYLVLAMIVACTPKASPTVTEAIIPQADELSKAQTTIAAGEVLFTTTCARCHKPKHEAVASQSYEELRPILASMVRKAKLNKDEIEQVSAYVWSHAAKSEK